MKGGGGGGDHKQGRSRLPVLQLEASQRFRRVSAVVGCFLFVLVFLLASSSQLDVAVFDTLSLKTSLRAPATVETLGPFAGHEDGDTTTAAETNVAVREAETEESGAAASTSNPDDRRTAQGAAEAVQGNAVHVTAAAIAAQPTMETTPPQHELPRDKGIITSTRADPVVDLQRQPLCDFSSSRADLCDFTGDIRLDANSSTFIVVDPTAGANGTTTHKVRPYPRKGDATAMGRVSELTVRTAGSAPRCTVTHAAPAVTFSVGGYAGNLFHDFTDVIVPLYSATRRYAGDVQLVVADAAASPRWLERYGALLRGLSHHAPLDLRRAAAAGEVHCFRHAAVGLRAHRELLLIERERGDDDDGPPRATMPDFARFLRRALSLPRDDAATRPPAPGDDGARKPRLLIITRRDTRRILNTDAVARAAAEAGFEAVTTRELGAYRDDVARVARLVNSYDAVVGVHGADLTNVVFLPRGAAVVEIVPWGGLRWIARLDFGDAAEAMGLGYVQYEVAVEESTLKDKYPRDHEVLSNPTALHRKGFTFMRRTFLNGQDMIIDVDRFRPVLLRVLRNLA